MQINICYHFSRLIFRAASACGDAVLPDNNFFIVGQMSGDCAL